MTYLTVSFCIILCLVKQGVFSQEDDIEYVEPAYLEMLFRNGDYEEFAKLTRIDNVDLVRPKDGGAEKEDDDPYFQEGLEDGDIILSHRQKEQSRQGLIWPSEIGSKWEGNYVPYVINPEGYSLKDILTIRRAINKWNLEVRNPMYRPRLFEPDYVMFFNGTACYSQLGKQGGQQTISLNWKCLRLYGTILHEMVHTVGITHEHQRPDRDDYIKVLWDNIPEKYQPSYAKESLDDFVLLSEYDYYSVMHYPIPSPKTYRDAFAILKEGVDRSQVGQRVDMTDKDKEKVRKLYS